MSGDDGETVFVKLTIRTEYWGDRAFREFFCLVKMC